MRIQSIQLKIALLAGVCVVAASTALVGYSIVSAAKSKTFVGDNLAHLTEDATKTQLKTLALAQASLIEAPLNAAFDAARNMARMFEVSAVNDGGGTPAVGQQRARFNAILLNVLKDNPGFNGTYSAWEPDALDGQDRLFRDRNDIGSDATGRFLPYWTRSADGRLAVQPLVEYDSRELHPNGVMKGGWYIGPQSGGGESILDPLPYIVQGKPVYLATMSVPIMVEGRFVGVAGADFDLTFVQKLATDVKASIYGGKASVDIVSHMGLVVASSDHPEAIGSGYDKVNTDASTRCRRSRPAARMSPGRPKASQHFPRSSLVGRRRHGPWLSRCHVRSPWQRPRRSPHRLLSAIQPIRSSRSLSGWSLPPAALPGCGSLPAASRPRSGR